MRWEMRCKLRWESIYPRVSQIYTPSCSVHVHYLCVFVCPCCPVHLHHPCISVYPPQLSRGPSWVAVVVRNGVFRHTVSLLESWLRLAWPSASSFCVMPEWHSTYWFSPGCGGRGDPTLGDWSALLITALGSAVVVAFFQFWSVSH